MTTKSTLQQYFWTALLAFQVIALAGCAGAQPNIANIQNTAIALTQTALPPTFTPTATTVYPTPSPIPTQPSSPIFTPDAIQVERWKEYQTELAENFLSMRSPFVLCEWEILGRVEQKIYVWAVCESSGSIASIPAVIQVSTDGTIQKVEVPGIHSNWSSDIKKMFPADVQGKFDYYHFGEAEKMSEHLKWRLEHPGVPPLIVLSATPTP